MVGNRDQVIVEVEGPLEVAYRQARAIADDTQREVAPVRVFKQGPRRMVSGVLPVRVVLRLLSYQAAAKGTTAAKAVGALNRPVNSEHVSVIQRYLVDALRKNEKYILPGLTLSAKRGMQVYVPKGMSGPVTGYAVLPEEQVLSVTDGMHRFLALQRAAEELRGTEVGAEFLSDGIPVMITIEEDVYQIHQDFADASKTKPLPPSLIAIWDTRQVGNRAVIALVEGTRLFKERIDTTSVSLSVNSQYIFLANQIRQFVKSSLSGNPSMTDPAFTKSAEMAIGNDLALKRWVDSRIRFMEILTELIPEWRKIAGLPTPGGPEGPKVYAEMRRLRDEKHVSLSAAALNALGLVSHRVFTTRVDIAKPSDLQKLPEILEPLRTVNWDRSKPIWEGNLVQAGKIKTQSPNVKAAAAKLLALIEPEERQLIK